MLDLHYIGEYFDISTLYIAVSTLYFPTNHCFGYFRDACLVFIQVRDNDTVPHNKDLVTDFHYFMEAVCDEDN